MTWQPIETYPKDNKARLVWCPGDKSMYEVVWWIGHDDAWWVHFGPDRHERLRSGPTHWMELPPSPIDLFPALLPCPFCGGMGELGFWMNQSLIRCRECRSSTSAFDRDDQTGRKAAIAAWNRRISPAEWAAVHAARARFEMAARALGTAETIKGLTRCDYCRVWRKSPCGEDCCWQPTT